MNFIQYEDESSSAEYNSKILYSYKYVRNEDIRDRMRGKTYEYPIYVSWQKKIICKTEKLEAEKTRSKQEEYQKVRYAVNPFHLLWSSICIAGVEVFMAMWVSSWFSIFRDEPWTLVCNLNVERRNSPQLSGLNPKDWDTRSSIVQVYEHKITWFNNPYTNIQDVKMSYTWPKQMKRNFLESVMVRQNTETRYLSWQTSKLKFLKYFSNNFLNWSFYIILVQMSVKMIHYCAVLLRTHD